jgi:hypothetical protein
VGLAILTMVAGLLVARAHRLDRACIENLERIFAALTTYTELTGTLPGLALYPDDPQVDEDSLLVVLRRFGIDEQDLLCPATHGTLQATGNTYLWNTRLSGKRWSEIEAAQWMLVEINAMSSRVPAPHHKHYNVLYSNGEVRSESSPPAVL